VWGIKNRIRRIIAQIGCDLNRKYRNWNYCQISSQIPRQWLSDFLEKNCARADIPTPDHGYWAKRKPEKQGFSQHSPSMFPVWMMRSLIVVPESTAGTDA
jgi:hypothetical protein